MSQDSDYYKQVCWVFERPDGLPLSRREFIRLSKRFHKIASKATGLEFSEETEAVHFKNETVDKVLLPNDPLSNVTKTVWDKGNAFQCFHHYASSNSQEWLTLMTSHVKSQLDDDGKERPGVIQFMADFTKGALPDAEGKANHISTAMKSFFKEYNIIYEHSGPL